ncbi:hypothetical protein [Variovorax sp. JS1663]|uniref:hypothetical protein n=1 Tax=Variovorax sp. JS1663 TaxID=1851577 RepID=UPI000B34559C|nr:hypothetical protein [Variovorax sp. JS1663]OUM00790.1 hypothetical protein A8M77_19035 [Variovorax sp. JS1663]
MKRSNLTGQEATWIVAATLAVQALPTVLNFVIKCIELGRVKRIKVGEIEIENPTRDDIERLREKIKSD